MADPEAMLRVDGEGAGHFHVEGALGGAGVLVEDQDLVAEKIGDEEFAVIHRDGLEGLAHGGGEIGPGGGGNFPGRVVVHEDVAVGDAGAVGEGLGLAVGEGEPANVGLGMQDVAVGGAVDVFVVDGDGVGQGVGVAVADLVLRVHDVGAGLAIPFAEVLAAFVPVVGGVDISGGIDGHRLDVGGVGLADAHRPLRAHDLGGVADFAAGDVVGGVELDAAFVVAGGRRVAEVVAAIPGDVVVAGLLRVGILEVPDGQALLVENLDADLVVAGGLVGDDRAGIGAGLRRKKGEDRAGKDDRR